MEIQEALNKLDTLQRKMIAYNHALGLIDYDGATAAPAGAAANRAETLALLSEESYKLSTGDKTVALLDNLHENIDSLDSVHRRIVQNMYDEMNDMRRVPMAEYVEYQRLNAQSQDAWHQAKEKDDYALFKPYLEKMIAANRQLMRYMKPDLPTYDALLDRYEKGLTRARCDAFFDTVRKELVPLIHAVNAAPQVDDSCLFGHFPIAEQRRLSDYLAENADLLKKRTIAEQLSRRLVEKGLTRADVISAAGLNDIYAHQIFAGKRRPSRDKVLCLAFGMALTADETQTLIKDCGYAVLYAKDRRDSIILYALYNRQNLMKLNEALYDEGERLVE